MVDVSIILNIHRERAYARRTLASIEAAVRYASIEDVTCELVVVADRSDPETLDWYKEQCYKAFVDTTILEVDNASLGLSRNDGINNAVGEFILTADADDLMSVNTILETIKAARSGGEKTVYFPKWCVAFSTQTWLCEFLPLSLVGAEAFFGGHPYVSRFFARREEIASIRFKDLRLTSGFAFEDWQFNMDLVAAGFSLEVVPEVTIYYRQTANSLLRQANAVSLSLPDWSRLFEPRVYLSMAQKWPRSNIDSYTTSHGSILSKFLLSGPQIEMMLMASEIDPAINPISVQRHEAFSNIVVDMRPGKAWTKICEMVGDNSFEDILLVPFLTLGGGERYIFNVIDSMLRQDLNRKVLIISGQEINKQFKGFIDCERIVFLDLPEILGFYDENFINIITLRALQAFGRNSRIHIKSSEYTCGFVRKYAKVLKQQIIYYRFCDASYYWSGQFVCSPDGYVFLSDLGDAISKIICDNEFICKQDTLRLDHLTPRYEVLYNWVSTSLEGRAGKTRQRVLWASRLDDQKRLNLLVEVANKLILEAPDVTIDVWGSEALNDACGNTISILQNLSNVKLCGGFFGFETLPLESYGLFLYTSAYDGLPNVVLEAMRAGFPVISSVLGGIGEVLTEDTGYPLSNELSDEKLAEAYVRAIQEVISAPEECQQKIQTAQRLMNKRHDINLYDRHIARLFSLEGTSEYTKEENA